MEDNKKITKYIINFVNEGNDYYVENVDELIQSHPELRKLAIALFFMNKTKLH